MNKKNEGITKRRVREELRKEVFDYKKLRSYHWLERELEKFNNPIDFNLSVKCYLCSHRARIKVTLNLDNQISYYCLKHGEEYYWNNKDNIKEIEKKGWYSKEQPI